MNLKVLYEDPYDCSGKASKIPSQDKTGDKDI